MSQIEKQFRWTPKLLRMIKEAQGTPRILPSYFIFPINEETIRLDIALSTDELISDYSQYRYISLDQSELFQFMYRTGAINFDDIIEKFTPVIAYDICQWYHYYGIS